MWQTNQKCINLFFLFPSQRHSYARTTEKQNAENSKEATLLREKFEPYYWNKCQEVKLFYLQNSDSRYSEQEQHQQQGNAHFTFIRIYSLSYSGPLAGKHVTNRYVLCCVVRVCRYRRRPIVVQLTSSATPKEADKQCETHPTPSGKDEERQ